LRRTHPHIGLLPVFDNSGGEPLADQSQDSHVANPVLEESHHPGVIDGVEERLDVCIEHPVHALRQHAHHHGVQRLMLVAPRSEAIREAEEGRLVNRRKYCHHGLLNDFVLQRRDAKRALLAVRLGDVHPA
jgi:hypothetical protein